MLHRQRGTRHGVLHNERIPSKARSILTTTNYSRLLPGVPLIESPFFAKIVPELGLDEETRRIAFELHLFGYSVIDFPEPNFDELAESTKSALIGRFDWDWWIKQGHQEGTGMRAWDAWKDVESIRRIAANARIIELLSTLYGRKAWPFQTLNFPVGTQQHIHTDAVHFHSNPERFMCGVWVAMEDVTVDNGPLAYYPGSHKWPVYTNEHIGYCVSDHPQRPSQAIYEEMWQGLIEAHHAQPQVFLCKKGQALIWAANLLHGGCLQRDKHQTRWSQVTHYFFDDCAYYTPMWSDPFHGRVYFRRPINVVSGQIEKHAYVGHDLPARFVSDSMNGYHDFDAALYLEANPDVAAAGTDPLAHYLTFGIKELRRLRPPG